MLMQQVNQLVKTEPPKLCIPTKLVLLIHPLECSWFYHDFIKPRFTTKEKSDMKHPLWIERHMALYLCVQPVAPSALKAAFRLFPIMLASQSYRLFRKLCPHISRISSDYAFFTCAMKLINQGQDCFSLKGKKKEERKERVNIEWMKSHKSAHACPVFLCFLPSLRGLTKVWHHSLKQ